MLSLLMFVSWLMGALPCQVDWNSLQVQENFDLDRYMGVWYEISYSDPEEPPGSPWIMDNLHYAYNRSTPLVALAEMVGNMRSPPDSPCFRRNGKGYMQLDAQPLNRAKMIYKISRSGKFPDSHYYVLSTDYDDYALVIQCPVIKLRHDGVCEGGSKLNVLSRSKVLGEEGLNAVRRHLAERRLCVTYDDLLTIRFNKDCR